MREGSFDFYQGHDSEILKYDEDKQEMQNRIDIQPKRNRRVVLGPDLDLKQYSNRKSRIYSQSSSIKKSQRYLLIFFTSDTPFGSPSLPVPGNQPGPFTKAETFSAKLSMEVDLDKTLP